MLLARSSLQARRHDRLTTRLTATRRREKRGASSSRTCRSRHVRRTVPFRFRLNRNAVLLSLLAASVFQNDTPTTFPARNCSSIAGRRRSVRPDLVGTRERHQFRRWHRPQHPTRTTTYRPCGFGISTMASQSGASNLTSDWQSHQRHGYSLQWVFSSNRIAFFVPHRG
jgi:hypothetical protein